MSGSRAKQLREHRLGSARLTAAIFFMALPVTFPAGVIHAEQNPPTYHPIFADAGPSRVGSTNRSAFGFTDIMVFAPIKKGATLSANPTLYWYQSAATTAPIEFVIQILRADEPTHELQLQRSLSAGINSVSLEELGVTLLPNIEYEWSVSIVMDPERRSRDIFSMGSVQHVEPDALLREQLANASLGEQVDKLLSSGYWYDAMALLNSDAVTGDEQTALLSWRDAILNSQGLLAAFAAPVETGTPLE